MIKQKQSGKFVVLCVVGARPNFMKIAPIMAAIKASGDSLSVKLLHTGQHYDEAMSDQFFRDLGIRAPDINLGVGSGSHAAQTAEIMTRFEPVLDSERPDAVLVVGDVNSTIACALVAVKKGVPVIHVEAGLRSFDRGMPEEINRILTDQIADLLFTTEKIAAEHLLREGIESSKIHFVGNVMIDTLLQNLERAVPAKTTFAEAGAGPMFNGAPGSYAGLTLHRPSNVDDPKVLRSLLESVREVSMRIPVVFPLHPRTKKQIAEFGYEWLLDDPRILVLPPLGYLHLLGLMKDAAVFLTDSGAIQEETTALGVPCITLRESTERPITVDEGTNVVVGSDRRKIMEALDRALAGGDEGARIPMYWDGKASQRIVEITGAWLQGLRGEALNAA
jgi:UDP-N-acetylglucosamine 2-epimerase (non-hydrolysing)